MKLIYKNYFESSVVSGLNNNLMDIKKSMVNTYEGLVDYLDEYLKDEDENDNSTVAAKCM